MGKMGVITPVCGKRLACKRFSGRDGERSRMGLREKVGCDGLGPEYPLRGYSELGQEGWAFIPCFD